MNIISMAKNTGILALLMSLSCVLYAQEQSPQNLQVIDETDEPAITIRKTDNDDSITEKRKDGVVEEIKVKSGASTYYIKPNDAKGVPVSVNGEPIKPAMWKIGEFDLGQDTKQQKQQETDLTIESKNPLDAPALPPPTIK